MGIKGLYGYCAREIKSCYKTVNIVEEIAKYKSEHKKPPLILINLSTLSYHFKLNTKDLICGFQLNKIKFEVENFFHELRVAGACLEFFFKKTVADDKEWKRRRLSDYHLGCDLITIIEKVQKFENLDKIFRREDKFPWNPIILVCLIQSAEKFGIVHGCNSLKGKPAIQQVEYAREKEAAWIMGLDTYYFLLPGGWKIWCDTELKMDKLTIRELDPNLVMQHFELKPEQAPLFACLVGDLQSIPRVVKKVVEHFGSKSLFINAAKCIRGLKSTSLDENIREIIEKIFGGKSEPFVFEDFKKSIKTFQINHELVTKVDWEILKMVQNDFLSVAEEILLNTPIFVNPSFLDMRKTDMKSINDLVVPFLQRTAGVLLKNQNDPEPRTFVLLKSHGSDEFTHETVDIIYPEFDVPDLKTLLAGDMSTMDKMQMLFWITDLELKDFEIPVIPEEFVADTIILLYLLKNKSLRLVDARCIFKSLVDARQLDVPEISTEYPEMIDGRAYRVSYLYSKMYFYFHSCMSALGMKNLCPDIQFDGVYFQKMYAVNESEMAKENAENLEYDEDFCQTDVVDDFAVIIRN